MNEELQKYLVKTFPSLYNDPEFKGFNCDNGWFRTLTWLSRYLISYIELQNYYSDKFPDKYLPVKKFKIKEISTKQGVLEFNTHMSNERIDAVLSFVQFLSGYVCSETGKIDNVGFSKEGIYRTIHESINKNGDFVYVDNKDFRELIKKHFN